MGNSLPPTEGYWPFQDGTLTHVETDIAGAPETISAEQGIMWMQTR